ncbi:MAG: hypothetical protein LQ342_005618 [Letrouitia transgressa]|nr:MAG: hypothetical protein LQ342_005618 [Letrouitia transgressa]
MRYSSAIVAVAATLASGSSAAAVSGGAPSATGGIPSATGGAPAATGTGGSVPSNTFGGNEPSKTLGGNIPTGTGINKDGFHLPIHGPHIPIFNEPLKPECDMFKPYVAKVLLKKVCNLHLTPLPPGETGIQYEHREGFKERKPDATGAPEPTGSAFGGAPSATSNSGPASFTLNDPAPTGTPQSK